MDECSGHKGRLYDLCTGMGHDGRPNPTQEACDRFRDKHGKDKIEVQNPSAPSPERHMVRPMDMSNVGSLLLVMFKERVKAIPCSACKETVKSLNLMTVADIRKNRDKIVDKIVKNSKGAGKAWWATLLEKVDNIVADNAVTKKVIGMWLDEACDMASTIEPQPAESIVSVTGDIHPAEPSPQKQITEHSGGDYPDNEWCVVVTTAPRKGDYTLDKCLQSLVAAGWTKPIVFAEPGSIVPDGVNVITNQVRRGCFHNWLQSAKWAIENTTAEKILCVQDDAYFHPDSRDFVDQHCIWPSENTAFVSLYTPSHYSVTGSGKKAVPRPVGINLVTTSCLWGTLAVAWKRDVLQQVVNHSVTKNWKGLQPKQKPDEEGNPTLRAERVAAYFDNRTKNPHLINNSDYVAGNVVGKLRKQMYFIDPSPVSHIAKVSTISHGGNKGRRNCGRCAKHGVSLYDQVMGGGGSNGMDHPDFKTMNKQYPRVIVPGESKGLSPPHRIYIRSSFSNPELSAYRWGMTRQTLLPSLASQVDKNFEIYLICDGSDCLQQEKLAAFNAIAPTVIAPEDWYNAKHDGVWRRLTRVDDDDVLSVHFTELISAEVFDGTECAMTFPNGIVWGEDKWQLCNYPGNQFLTIQTNTQITPFHFPHGHYIGVMPSVHLSSKIHWAWIRHGGALSGRKSPGGKPRDIPGIFKWSSFSELDHSMFRIDIDAIADAMSKSAGINSVINAMRKETKLDVSVIRRMAPESSIELTRIADRYSCDKGLFGNWNGHNYTLIYDRLFRDRRDSVEKVLEFGVDAGASLKMWSDYFPNAKIDGLDIKKRTVKHPRVFVHKRDALRPLGLGPVYDLIVDDASHISSHQRRLFDTHAGLVKPGGYYVIEDLHVCRIGGHYLDESPSMLETCREWVTNPPSGWSADLYGDCLCVLRKV